MHKIRAIVPSLWGKLGYRHVVLLVCACAGAAAPSAAIASDTSNSLLGPSPVSAGGSHSCGVGATGLLACWGDDSSGQTDNSGGRFLTVSAGGEHTCGIRESSVLACWGDNSRGQRENVPAGQFIALSAGGHHTCAIGTDGTLACWGDDSAGQLENIPGGRFVEVSSGGAHSCAIGADGTLACWGDDSAGQLDNVPAGRFVDVSSGGTHSCAIGADGTLACWGDDSAGQLDNVPGGRFRAVSAGGTHSCAIAANGTLDCWGDDSAGQLDNIPGGRFRAVSAGGTHSCAVRTDGETICWGSDLPGQPAADPPSGPYGQIALTAGNGSNYNCAIRLDGRPQCWGADAFGSPTQGIRAEGLLAVSGEAQRACALLADGSPECWGPPELVASVPPPAGAFRAISSTADDSCAIGLDGNLACWGDPEPVVNPPAGTFREVSGGSDYACGIRTDGTLDCWGGSDLPVLREAPTGVFRAVSTGNDRACAVRADGTLACWGANELGYVEPVPSGPVRDVASGAYHTCAILSDGELACWEDGETVAALSGTFDSLAAGANHTCGQATDGTVSCWGHNDFGQVQPQVAELELPPAVVGTPYSHQLLATPQEPAPEFSVTAGSLPDGLGLAPDGELSGTPTAAGHYAFTVAVRDGIAPDSEEAVTMDVAAAPDSGLPPPVAGQSFNIETVEGTVKTKCPADSDYTGLVRAEQVPVGCLIDTTFGTVRITASKGNGQTQTAQFWGGVFRVTQHSGVNQTAVMKLVGQLRCEKRGGNARARRVSRRRGGGRKLWGSGKGNYKTVGSHGAATVRGTVWLVQDRCDGSTLIKVKSGTVWIRDFVKGIRVVLHAGDQYVIEPPTPRLGK